MRRNRKQQKAETRELVMSTARRLFSENTYETVSIRRLAAEMGRTVGTIFPYFSTKADLWRAVMGTEPPLDSALTRQASDIEKSLRRLVRLQKVGETTPGAWEQAWNEADQALRSLDGEAREIGAQPTIASVPASAVDELKPLEGPARMQLILDVLDTADRTNWRPVSFRETADALTEACLLVTQREMNVASDAEVYNSAVQGAARLLIVAARGVAFADQSHDKTASTG